MDDDYDNESSELGAFRSDDVYGGIDPFGDVGGAVGGAPTFEEPNDS